MYLSVDRLVIGDIPEPGAIRDADCEKVSSGSESIFKQPHSLVLVVSVRRSQSPFSLPVLFDQQAVDFVVDIGCG